MLLRSYSDVFVQFMVFLSGLLHRVVSMPCRVIRYGDMRRPINVHVNLWHKEVKVKTRPKDAEVFFDGCTAQSMIRPDGSLLITVTHKGRKLERVFEHTCPIAELIRTIRYDLASAGNDGRLIGMLDLSSLRPLPTYVNKPLHETRCARLWRMRKLKGC